MDFFFSNKILINLLFIFLVSFFLNYNQTNATTTALEDTIPQVIQPNQTNATTTALEDTIPQVIQPNQTNATTTALEDTIPQVIQPNQTNATTTALEDTIPQVIQPDKPELLIKPTFKDPITAGEKQIITVNVKDTLSQEDLEDVLIDGNITFLNKNFLLGKGETNKKGNIVYTIPIPISSEKKIQPAIVFINAYKYKYDNQTEKIQFKISSFNKLFALLFDRIELKDVIENKGYVPIKLFIHVTNKSQLPISINKINYTLLIDEIPYKKYTRQSTWIIPPVNTTNISFDIYLLKSKIDEYIYRQISIHPTESDIFEYRLKGSMDLTFNNKNITIPYNDVAGYVTYKQIDYDILPIVKD